MFSNRECSDRSRSHITFITPVRTSVGTLRRYHPYMYRVLERSLAWCSSSKADRVVALWCQASVGQTTATDYRFGRLSVLSPRVLRTHSAALVGPRCALAVVVLLLGVRALSTLPSILHGSPLYGVGWLVFVVAVGSSLQQWALEAPLQSRWHQP